MTPKQKALELVNKYGTYVVMWAGDKQTTNQNIKQCASIAVDEILGHSPMSPVKQGQYYELTSDRISDAIAYWLEVKKEIEQL